jgi:hypothetical protein
MTADAPRESVLRRAVRAARLDPALYREVALDERATSQALLVVVTVSIVGALGGVSTDAGLVIASVLLAPLAWLLTSVLAQFIGTRVIGAQGAGGWQQVARALGYAHAPAIIGGLVVLPVFGVAVAGLLIVWRIAAMLVAVRASMGVSTGQAVMILLLSAITLGVAVFVMTWIATGGSTELAPSPPS